MSTVLLVLNLTHILIIWIDLSYFLCTAGKAVKFIVFHDVAENLFAKCWILLSLSEQFLFICEFLLVSDIQYSLYVLFLFFGPFPFEFGETASVRSISGPHRPLRLSSFFRNVYMFIYTRILSRVGCVTRQINSRRLRIQRFIERSLLHTQVQSFTLAVSPSFCL
jgi:hypothetical protein